MKIRLSILFFLALLLSLNTAKATFDKLNDGLYAKIITNKGDILINLAYKKAPLTVINFVGLAEGTKKNNVLSGQPYYDGLKFHRVVNNFMIQGGDPLGNGTGGPGYQFSDEITNLKHDSAGILSMANSGKNTNGSQFFITHLPTPHLDGKHTVFGKVVSGLSVVNKIKKGDAIKHIKIIRVGKVAKTFQTNQKAFLAQQTKYKKKSQQANIEQKKEFLKFIKTYYPNSQSTPSGLHYIVLKKGAGKQAKVGDTVTAHYILKLTDNKEIANSRKERTPFTTQIGVGRLIKAWDEMLPTMKEGERRIIIAPYQLAYGQKGVGIIPPKATLIFDVELLKINP